MYFCDEVMHFVFCFIFFNFIFVILFYSPKQGNSLNFPSMEYAINNLSARE